VNRRLQALFLGGAMLAVAGCDGSSPLDRTSPSKVNQPVTEARTNGDGITYFLPDFRPWWASDSVRDIRFDVGRSNDRLVSCDDWTLVGDPPTGMTVLSFTLSSPNFGQGDLRLRRNFTPDGIEMYQTISQMNADGVCSAVEFDQPVAVIPNGPGQSGRWLPLAKFALYTIAEDGSIGDRVACQVKRWCCLGSASTCPTRGPCPRLPTSSDNIEAGARDVYPFHWTDQFLPIEGIPSGTYWFEDEINPAVPYPTMYESDYSNNSMFFQIAIDQEARTVQIVQGPDASFSTCPAP
jgi:hypothetical protein